MSSRIALGGSDTLTGTGAAFACAFLVVADGVVLPPTLTAGAGEVTAGVFGSFGVTPPSGRFGVLRGIAGLIVVGAPIGGGLAVAGGTGVAGWTGAAGAPGTAASAPAGRVDERVPFDLCRAA